MVRPVVDRRIALGALPTLEDGPRRYRIEWPTVEDMDTPKKVSAAVALAGMRQDHGVVVTSAEIREQYLDLPLFTPEQRRELAFQKMLKEMK